LDFIPVDMLGLRLYQLEKKKEENLHEKEKNPNFQTGIETVGRSGSSARWKRPYHSGPLSDFPRFSEAAVSCSKNAIVPEPAVQSLWP
jgi:hypothetical protein